MSLSTLLVGQTPLKRKHSGVLTDVVIEAEAGCFPPTKAQIDCYTDDYRQRHRRFSSDNPRLKPRQGTSVEAVAPMQSGADALG